MTRGFLKKVLDRLAVLKQQARSPKAAAAKRAHAPRNHGKRQRVRWADDEVVWLEPQKGAKKSTQKGATKNTIKTAPEVSRRRWRLPSFKPSNPRKFALTALPVILGLGALLSFAVVSYNKLERQPASESQPGVDPLAAYSDSVKTELLTPKTRMPAKLKLTFTGKPDDLCQELAALGLANTGWQRAPFSTSRWQCASDLVPLTTASVDYGPSTLFFLLRGPDRDSVDYLRLKLNVEDPKQIEIGQEAVRLVIGALSERYAWDVPARFLKAIAEFRPLEMTDRGVRLSVAPEDPNLTGDPAARQRLNIVLDFGEPDLIRSTGKFEPLPGKRHPVRPPFPASRSQTHN